jgi:signal transduction histidine kinase
VLIVAPMGADAVNTANFLRTAGIGSFICRNLSEAAERLDESCGALLVTEEATFSRDCDRVRKLLASQPPWSDLPVIFIGSGNSRGLAISESLKSLGPPLSAILLERPLHAATLVAAVRSGLAARQRQYQVRDLLGERDRLLGSLEQQVAERTAKLRQMVEELEGFSYSVSHDLRSPLRVLDGYARALSEDYADKLDPQAQLYLDRISRAAQRMDRLTQDILAYSRVSRMALTLQPVDLDALIRDVIDQYPTLATFKSAFKIREPLGCVVGHAAALTQCISNLLENAVKFARDRVPLCVEIYTTARDDTVRLSIDDNGCGISPENQARIFGLFERAAPKDVAGTGIGLAIVKKAVDRMGGKIGVSSRPGQGACFWLELPRAPASAECSAA